MLVFLQLTQVMRRLVEKSSLTQVQTLEPLLKDLLVLPEKLIDNTIAEQHDVGDNVRKYEAYGVSLRRINTTHRLAQVSNNVRNDLDYYHIKIDTTSTGIGTVRDGTNSFPELRIAESGLSGGARVKESTQNTQFEVHHSKH